VSVCLCTGLYVANGRGDCQFSLVVYVVPNDAPLLVKGLLFAGSSDAGYLLMADKAGRSRSWWSAGSYQVSGCSQLSLGPGSPRPALVLSVKSESKLEGAIAAEFRFATSLENRRRTAAS